MNIVKKTGDMEKRKIKTAADHEAQKRARERKTLEDKVDKINNDIFRKRKQRMDGL